MGDRKFAAANVRRAFSVGLLLFGVVLLWSRGATAQQSTFYLDRLTLGGAPDDGIAVWRPVMSPKTRFFGQMALGLSVNPLRASTVAPNAAALRKIGGSPVFSQVIDYMTLGAELSERVSFLATLPVALIQGGAIPAPGSEGVRAVGSVSRTSPPTICASTHESSLFEATIDGFSWAPIFRSGPPLAMVLPSVATGRHRRRSAVQSKAIFGSSS
jgi:hypothetical protein